MASDKYLLLLCAFSCLCCVMCDLNLSEGSPCVTDGVNGTCVGIYKCPTAAFTYNYANAGSDPVANNFPKLPDICSIKNNEFVVCCTDCELSETGSDHDYLIGPFGFPIKNHEHVARTKCHEYFQRLPYPCHGDTHVRVYKKWNNARRCYDYSQSIAPFGAGAGGGRDAQRWEFPHSALIGFGKDLESARWLCGGSVISERFILTAAHCSSTHTLGNISFAALGLLKRTDPAKYWKIHKIKRIILHPKYKSPSKYHDIALLETETEINFGKDLLPACLDTLLSADRVKFSAQASGWGRLGHSNSLADTLQVVNLYRYSEIECASIYPPHRHLKRGYDQKTQMCYGDQELMVDTCEGDSGGPLQTYNMECLYTIIGVTSFGVKCGQIGSAGMYTRVSYYVPWIESIVWPEETEAQRKRDNEWLEKWLS